MKRLACILVLIFFTLSCKDENPSPTLDLEYVLPYQQYMDGAILTDLDRQIGDGRYGEIHSLIILRNGNVVYENYYSNSNRADLHPMGASTQSVISALVGIQDYRDDSFSLSTKVIDYFPEYLEYFENVPQKDQIELRHLLAHSSGFWWDEETYPFGTDENDAYQMSISDDWIANVLSTPMIKEPGADFNFNSGNAILIGAILEKQASLDVEEFASAQLFSPLGIKEWKWDRISDGRVNAAWGLHLRALDMAKIGHLYIEEGLWKENRIFADNWHSRSSRSRFYASSYFNYGYFWWRFGGFADVVRYLERNDIFFSWGEGGQFIFVVPHLDLVAVTTAGNYNNNETLAIDMFRDYILPSVVPRPF